MSSFLDTNILLYSISLDPHDQRKRGRAQQVLTGRDFVLSVQVLQEFNWRHLGGVLSASGRTLPGIEARAPSDQRERPGQKVASHFQATRPTRKQRVTHEIALILLEAWRRFPVLAVTEELFDRALNLCARHRLSYWDSAIIAAAAIAGCDEVLTEDMQHGAIVAGVRIHNPFLEAAP